MEAPIDRDTLWSEWKGDELSPTLKAYADFNADEDCVMLRTAMKGLGTDEKVIIDIFGHRTAAQRMQIVNRYKVLYGRDLKQELRSELSGHFEDTILALCLSPAEFDANELWRAMSGFGTNESVLIEILCSRTNDQIRRIKETYHSLFHRDLEEDIKEETSGNFRHVMISLVQAQRDEDVSVSRTRAIQDAEALFEAGEKMFGTDESVFNRVLATRSPGHIRLVIKEYAKISKRTLEEALKSEMSGDTLESFLTIVRCMQNKPKYFANQLKKSMQGLGTRDHDLIRIIVSRCEIDMGYIKDEFFELTGKTLGEWIEDDTSGNYRRILLALIGNG
ncbi:unnamed protein product [Calicophoron daubneyi]|uniref:Annexin n=1 Tax=Calicophoron daubneyi TaxID=300641 RepID=A0AAV2TLR8_CALDB